MDHTVPTVGYIIDELSRPGALHASRIRPILEANGIPMNRLKGFKSGDPIVLPTGASTLPRIPIPLACPRAQERRIRAGKDAFAALSPSVPKLWSRFAPPFSPAAMHAISGFPPLALIAQARCSDPKTLWSRPRRAAWLF
jgi:hypothetical protein